MTELAAPASTRLTPPSPRNDAEDFSILAGYARVVLEEIRTVLAITAVVTLIVVLILFFKPRSYTASASFAPQGRKLPSNLSGLAAQFGVSVPGDEPSESPQFYADLIKTRAVLEELADSVYDVPANPPARMTLARWYGQKERTPALQRDKAVTRLRDDVSASTSTQTGVVSLKVRSRSPVLSDQIAARLLSIVNAFNLDRRRTQAAAERAFAESRVASIRGDLRAAEGRLQDFLQHNANCCEAPSLRFEEQRLSRDVSTQQQLYTTMLQSFEQAKIDEVRDTPVITIIEPPTIPVRPDSRRAALLLPLGVIAGTALGAFVVIGRRWMRDARLSR